LEWLKTCFDAFAHASRPPETFFQKRFFWTPGVFKRVLHAFALFFNKDIFYRLEWLKPCFDAFAHTSRTPETFFQKRYFLPSEVVKTVFWCICAYFENTRNFFLKNIFFSVWSG
jgi:hypothetical protein